MSKDIENWYSKYYKKMYGYLILRIKDRHIAEDIIQEAFISAWKSIDKLDINKQFDCWIITILKRRLVDHLRRNKKFYNIEDVELTYEDPEFEEFSSEVQNSLDQINQDLAKTFLLVIVHDYTHQEAANKLNVPIGTILSRVNRAREQLRKKLLKI